MLELNFDIIFGVILVNLGKPWVVHFKEDGRLCVKGYYHKFNLSKSTLLYIYTFVNFETPYYPHISGHMYLPIGCALHHKTPIFMLIF